MKPIIFMFSGQGSHYYNMGRAMFEQNALFKKEMIKADRICQDLIGISILSVLYPKYGVNEASFSRTLFTHPAIFMIEYALGQVLIEQHNIIPYATLGTSLGEFAASVFAGVLGFETALIAVITQAQMIEKYCEAGNMLAIFNSYSFYDNSFLMKQKCELASINFDTHFVIACSHDNIEVIEEYLKSQEVMGQQLEVSHAFHSTLISPAKPYYFNFISQQKVFYNPNIPFISSAYQQPLDNVEPSHFWNVISLPIQFKDTIQQLEKENNYCYLDVGPSGTLATFVKYNISKGSLSKSIQVLSPFNSNLVNFESIKNQLL